MSSYLVHSAFLNLKIHIILHVISITYLCTCTCVVEKLRGETEKEINRIITFRNNCVSEFEMVESSFYRDTHLAL